MEESREKTRPSQSFVWFVTDRDGGRKGRREGNLQDAQTIIACSQFCSDAQPRV